MIDTNDQEVIHKDDHEAHKATMKARERLSVRMCGWMTTSRGACSSEMRRLNKGRTARAIDHGSREGDSGGASVTFLGAPVVIVREDCDHTDVCIFSLAWDCMISIRILNFCI